MREAINLKEALLKNRWGRDQKIKPADKVRLAPFKSVSFSKMRKMSRKNFSA